MNIIAKLDYFEYALNCYALITREEDQLLFDGDDKTFKTESHTDPHVLMPEDSVNKGLYVAKIEDVNWQDGAYQISIFKRVGASPSPADDEKIGTGTIMIRNGMQAFSSQYNY